MTLFKAVRLRQSRQYHVDSGLGSSKNGIGIEFDSISGRGEWEILPAWACLYPKRALNYTKSHIGNIEVLTLGIYMHPDLNPT